MSSRRKGFGRSIPVDVRSTLRDDMAHLAELIDRMPQRLPARPLDDRELELTGGAVTPAVAEQQLRGIGALLVTLDTYLRARGTPSQRVEGERSVGSRPSARPARRNGASTAVPPSPGLAAAAARYIARDLVARQLSEFTSAEGYRLARELARIGRDEEAVEALLGQANQIRLHPVSLTEALSHSPR